jgi:hypothetical protein
VGIQGIIKITPKQENTIIQPVKIIVLSNIYTLLTVSWIPHQVRNDVEWCEMTNQKHEYPPLKIIV